MILCQITMNNNQKINIKLFEEYAPNTVENFVSLIKRNFYDGTTFHRVVPGFVIQGGCPIGSGKGYAGYRIKCETADNPLKHSYGVISMANKGPDTGSCQFFITLNPLPRLDSLHTVFGVVESGMDTVLNIQKGNVVNEIKLIK